MKRTRKEMYDAMGIPFEVLKRAILAAGIENRRAMLEEVQVEVAEHCVRILTREYDELAVKAKADEMPERLSNRLRKVSLYAAQAAEFRQAVKREMRNRPGVTPWVDWMGRTQLCADNDLLRI